MQFEYKTSMTFVVLEKDSIKFAWHFLKLYKKLKCIIYYNLQLNNCKVVNKTSFEYKKMLFQSFYIKISHFIICAARHFFVFICEIYSVLQKHFRHK